MRSVEKEWLELTGRNKSEGKLIRFYDAKGVPKFEGVINAYGWGTEYSSTREFRWARFYKCRTLNKDLSTRKGSATEREQDIPYDWQFIFVGEDKEISIPKTAGELTDDHIGMKFRFLGSPVIVGVYQGIKTPREQFESVHIGVDTGSKKAWDIKDRGYFIRRFDKLEYLGTPPAKELDTDAQLAAYLNQELGKFFDKIGSTANWPERNALGQEVVRLIKEITQPTP